MGHRYISRLGILALIALSATPARTAEPDAVELVDMFTEICLGKFPDDTAVRQFATEKRLDMLPAERLHRLLGTDPGVGWLQITARGQYVLTVEMPPYHTCAIRKSAARPPDFLATLSVVLGLWAAKQPGANLKQMPSQTAEVGGLPSQVYRWELDRGPGKQAESLMAIVTSMALKTEVRLARVIQIQ